MKKTVFICLSIVLLFILVSCTNSNIPDNEIAEQSALENGMVENSTPMPCEHDWRDATCQSPKICTKCSITDGEKIEHEYQSFTITPATCTETGKRKYECTKCKDVYFEETADMMVRLFVYEDYILSKDTTQ